MDKYVLKWRRVWIAGIREGERFFFAQMLALWASKKLTGPSDRAIGGRVSKIFP